MVAVDGGPQAGELGAQRGVRSGAADRGHDRGRHLRPPRGPRGVLVEREGGVGLDTAEVDLGTEGEPERLG